MIMRPAPGPLAILGLYAVLPNLQFSFLPSDQTLGLLHSPFALMLLPHLENKKGTGTKITATHPKIVFPQSTPML